MALLALLLGLGLALVLLEAGLRLFDPLGLGYEREFTAYRTQALQYEWEGLPPAAPGQLPASLDLDGMLYHHKPDLDLSLGSFRLRTNPLGCRGPAVAVPKPAGTFRILLLGDSVAFGWGVDDEVTFARRLEREWNDGKPARRLEVVNTGHPMYDTNQEAAVLRRLGAQLQPDLVLLVYVVNDVEPTRDVIEEVLTGKPPHPEEVCVPPDDVWSRTAAWLQPWLPATSKLLLLQTDLDARLRRVLPAGQDYAPERFGKGPRGWPRSQAALRDIQAQCRQLGAPLLVCDHTMPALPALPGFCRDAGIDLCELRFTPAEQRSGIANSRLDTHSNRQGHELLLQRLRAALQARRLLPG